MDYARAEIEIGNPMEDMDLIVSPAHKKLIVNHSSPNFPQTLVK